ncbi:AAA family ATPase [Oscillibacter sp.]|uniref:ATP-dependent nuclease n=1 Tax=Oscillibacter sp. TaxID=1945593 RepID=UPI003393805C
MLRALKFTNYRCFEETEISFRKMSLIVGSNNAGKSTIVEALRITAAVVNKFKTTNYLPAPSFLKLPTNTWGIKVNLDHLKIDLRTVVNQYKEDTYAEVEAVFEEKQKIKIYLSEEIAFATISDGKNFIKTKAEARKMCDLSLDVMPQIGLIREDEPMLSRDTIIQDMHTRLSSRHFRNELWQFREKYYERFKETAQETWRGLRIASLSYDAQESKINLLVYDSDYAAEIGLMGSGLQMWLQIIWFICHCEDSSTIVLDEPDVYMHPDLQVKIMKIAKSRCKQVIIATHSVEIISNANPHEIITVDKNTRKLKYASDSRAVQNAINNLGSNHNLSLIRIGTAKKCVFVEGKDLKTLSKFYELVYPESLTSLEQLPSVELGGWSRFDEALGTARLFYEETRGEVQTICILDRDYHTDEEIEYLYKRAIANHLQLHIWKKKELENYIVVPEAIFRITNLPHEFYPTFTQKLFDKLEELKEPLLGCISDQLYSYDRSKSPSFYRDAAISRISESWKVLDGRLSLVNGKQLISLINEWMREEYHKSCSQVRLLASIKQEEVSKEICEVIQLLR